MSQPASRPVPDALAERWRVEIDMPVFDEGRDRGKPVGWLSLNKLGGGVRANLVRWRQKQAWRLAAYLAYKRHRLPRGLDRVYVQVQFQFADRGPRDPANFELTIKPIVDAMQMEKSGIRYNPAKKRREPFVDKGWGIVAGDDPRYVVRGPEMPVGEPLGRKNPIKGRVIVYITPLPVEGT